MRRPYSLNYTIVKKYSYFNGEIVIIKRGHTYHSYLLHLGKEVSRLPGPRITLDQCVSWSEEFYRKIAKELPERIT